MRALQALVIIMGVLLVAGSVTVAVTIIHRMSSGTHHAAGGHVPAHADINLPPGDRVESVSEAGDRLALRVTGPQGEAILLVDPATGAIVETLDLHNNAPVPQP